MVCGVLGSARSAYIYPMSTDQIMQLTYLALLAAAIGGSAIVAGRNNMGKMAQQAAIWALIFVGVIGAYGLWEEIRNDVNPRQAIINESTVAVPRGNDGHYYLTLEVNDQPIRFVIDTGASQVVLSQDDAVRLQVVECMRRLLDRGLNGGHGQDGEEAEPIRMLTDHLRRILVQSAGEIGGVGFILHEDTW